MEQVWYADGLRFACVKGCTDCCITHGDHAYVYLEPEDIRNLTGHLGIDRGQFLERYAVQEDGWVMLRMDTPECPFLGDDGCTVYDARPVQCRTFPFWKENLRSRAAWEKTAGFCPGIDEGPRHSRERIQIQVASRSPERES